jgi:hypothetical protein
VVSDGHFGGEDSDRDDGREDPDSDDGSGVNNADAQEPTPERSNVQEGRRRAGRKPKGPDEDATNLCHGRTFQPTAVQEKNMSMWTDAKAQIPHAAADAEAQNAAPQRRERMTDIFRHQMEMQERLIQQYTQPNPLDAAMLAQFAPPAVAQQLLLDGVISKEDCDQARMHILTHD